MEPLVSIIIPVFNMESYLERCLNSVLQNTHHNLELICIDDGSRDRSMEILRDYEARDSRVVVIAKENGGVSSARNVGLDRHTGDYVTFLDPDDFIHPQFFSILLDAISATGADIAMGSYLKVQDEDIPVTYSVVSEGTSSYPKLNCMQVFRNSDARRYCTFRLYPSAALTDIRFREDMNYGEDTLFHAEIWEKHPNLTCCIAEQAVYYYYQKSTATLSQPKNEEKSINLVSVFAKKVQNGSDPRIFLELLISYGLPLRYITKYIRKRPAAARCYHRLLKTALWKLPTSPFYSGKRKIKLLLFICSPRLYRSYRFFKNPSLKQQEQILAKEFAAAHEGE